ncbi:transglutaminase [Microbispora corallina]|uniref:Transglutaminase n=1 Tax=Microbispora corallina TaxID=83302 RepID=A0ABQ4FQW1_9ACTN|nr:DUF3488 and transglutaminase-like domain-containing protein [Microbispora corallina]GIH37200.1 transglutaminase [Microbispora corallina]
MKLPVAAGLSTAAVAITLYPLFDGGAWFWASMGAILVVTVVGVVAGRLGARPWVTPVAAPFALLVYLTAVFTHDLAWLGVVPTKDSLPLLAELVSTGFDDIQRYAAPVPANPGITLLTAGGVGLIALLVDLFAVRLRRAALAGLPLLALFTVPAAVITDPIGWPAFVIGAFGYVGLLVADGRERLSHWGRAVVVRRSRTLTGGGSPDTGRLALSGKRIGVTAIALSILLPALLPALSPDPLFGFGVGNGLGSGGGTIAIPDAIAKLSGQLSQQNNDTVLTYTSSDDQPRYMRIYALDLFDGTKFTPSGLRGRPEDRVSEGPLPPAPGLGPAVTVKRAETRISISEDIGRLTFLPLPYPAVQVEADGDWRADESTLTVFSTKDEAAGLAYRVVTGEPEPTTTQLDTALPQPEGEARYVSLPSGLDPRIAALAKRVTSGATTQYQRAVKLQNWFTHTGKFTYNIRASGSGRQALSHFLFDERSGYCEQFASAMAVMARMLNIPARVAIGYTGGTKIGDKWTVRVHDAHAWPELYFAGVGWLRFEPTPAGAAGQGTAEAPQYTLPVTPSAGPSAGPSSGPATGTDDSDTLGRPSRPNPRQIDRDLGAVPLAPAPGMPVIAKVGVGAAVVLLLALIPAAARLLSRSRRGRVLGRTAPPAGAVPARAATAGGDDRAGRRPPADAAWLELCDTLTDLGMPRRRDESPRALGRRITERYELDAESAASLARIVSAEERLRYARTPAAAGPGRADVRRVRRALAGNVSRWRRLGAVVAPMSTLLRIRAVGERALDLFDLLEGVRLRSGPGPAAGSVQADRSYEAPRETTLTGSRR